MSFSGTDWKPCTFLAWHFPRLVGMLLTWTYYLCNQEINLVLSVALQQNIQCSNVIFWEQIDLRSSGTSIWKQTGHISGQIRWGSLIISRWKWIAHRRLLQSIKPAHTSHINMHYMNNRYKIELANYSTSFNWQDTSLLESTENR